MSAFDDSQNDNNVNSQEDLFTSQHDTRPAAANHMSSEISSLILAKLTSLEKIVQKIHADVEHLKSNANTSKAFTMDDCSFKKRLNAFLKEKFTRSPWLNAQTDLAFKNEVQKCLRIDGVGERNNVAYKVVCQYAAQRYTEYRNQLRRKLIFDIKAGKDVQSSAIDKFAEDYLAVYLSAGQQSDSRDRLQLCIILRSFLHTKKLNHDGSDALEFYCNFWQIFKEFFVKTSEDIKNDSKKIEKLQEIDNRRRLQRLGTEK